MPVPGFPMERVAVTVDRTQEAIDYIRSSSAQVGAFCGTSDVHHFLRETAREMAKSRPSEVFPQRYIEHVAYAVDMVASHDFTSSPAAIASVYLATRFEYYFRMLSGKLNADGTWVSSSAQRAAQGEICDGRLGKPRVSSVALAYKVMMLDHSRHIVRHCAALDSALYSTPTTVVGHKTVANIGDRIEFGRHAAGHGSWGDISAEALFYGLMTALVFYNQT